MKTLEMPHQLLFSNTSCFTTRLPSPPFPPHIFPHPPSPPRIPSLPPSLPSPPLSILSPIPQPTPLFPPHVYLSLQLSLRFLLILDHILTYSSTRNSSSTFFSSLSFSSISSQPTPLYRPNLPPLLHLLFIYLFYVLLHLL